MKLGLVTLFPDMIEAVTAYGVTRRAQQQGIIDVRCFNPRDYTADRHRTVDDRPYGGGPGMVMMTEPLRQAVNAAKQSIGEEAGVVYLSPQGRPFDQAMAREYSRRPGLILLAGRYEGIDQRVIDQCVDEEVSVGDFVVSGGELPAMLMMDAIARCLPGVLGHELSAECDSFADGLLDHPHYTRPEHDEAGEVPAVLLSGDHEAIRRWRLKQALGQTWLKRPDLLQERQLCDEEQRLLAEFQQEWHDTYA